MNKTNIPSEPTTKKDLAIFVEKINKRIEEVDKKIESTEKSLLGKIESTEKSLRVEIKFSTLTIKQKVDDNLKDLKNFLLTTFDPLLKELEDRRQDREIGSDQTARITEQVEKLEERIGKLEHSQQSA